jgi:hypothetical protein
MRVCLATSNPDGTEVTAELDDDQPGYPGPDVLDDMCSRARDLFRNTLADQAHSQTDHEKPVE